MQVTGNEANQIQISNTNILQVYYFHLPHLYLEGRYELHFRQDIALCTFDLLQLQCARESSDRGRMKFQDSSHNISPHEIQSISDFNTC